MDPAHALWIGGPQGAGRAALAGRIALRFGLRLYRLDARTDDHQSRLPVLGDDSFDSYARHRFRLALEDVREMEPGPPVLVEGAEILPTSVSAVLAHHDQALFVLQATPEDEVALTIAREVDQVRLASVIAGSDALQQAVDLLAPAIERLGGAER